MEIRNMNCYRKKLIEVALPLKAINEASAKEKSIRHGHPSTLHLWWARRPLAACRAVLFSSLVDDPDSDSAYRRADGTVDVDRAGVKRAELFNLIEELVLWENSNNPRVINAARAEIARCVASRKIELGEVAKATIIFGDKKGKQHPKGAVSGEGVTAWEVLLMKARPEVVNAFLAEFAPPVLDPFCGGGSIPLEAQRLGLRAYASDLNPVAVLITKALIEIPPKFAGREPVNPEWQKKSLQEKAMTQWQGAQGLAADVRYYGRWMRDEAEKRIGHFYPNVKISAEMAQERPDLKGSIGEELTVIAWLWARTVNCPNPACGASMPLARSFWLSTKAGKESWLEPRFDAALNQVTFSVRLGEGAFPIGTVKSRAVTCCTCGGISKLQYVRDEAQAGRMGSVSLAIVAETSRGRIYLDPSDEHEKTARSARARWKPDEQVPTPCHDVDRLPMYGMYTWGDAFTPRQLVALTTFSDLVVQARATVLADGLGARASRPRSHDESPLDEGGTGPTAYADAVATYLAFGVDKNTLTNCTLASWQTNPDRLTQAFSRQALSMTWDYAEANPLSDAGGGYALTLISLGEVLERLMCEQVPPGKVRQLDAAAVGTAYSASVAFSTDPPYYDNIGYADLSDWFYVWLRRTVGKVWPSLFATVLTPKKQELIATPHRHDGSYDKASRFFEDGLETVFGHFSRLQAPEVPISVFYAFKQSESDESSHDEHTDGETLGNVSTGWETMLEGLVRSGFAISGTWPIRTELVTSLKKTVSALASSIVLVCRPRPSNASLATRKEYMNALRRELPEALKNLQRSNIAPVDLAQASIGPGMAVFTRYAKVVESDGKSMTIRTALGIINQVLDEVLAEQEGDFDPDTRWALAWFEQYGKSEGPYGVAETLSKAKNTAINGLVEAGVVTAGKGKVQLVDRAELPVGWNPATDKRLTVWETTQHLIRTLETNGEVEAATLLNKLGGIGEIARELAYRLYSICERKKWAEEALSYNGLVIAWPELTMLVLAARNRDTTTQREMF